MVAVRWRSLPAGVHVEGAWHRVAADELQFLVDQTSHPGADERRFDQQIFDAAFDLVRRAETFLVLDFFLINDFAGDPATAPRALSGELLRLIEQRRSERPSLRVLLVTDPINRVYGGERHPGLERLEEIDVEVAWTRLERLRDSNPMYSAVYRMLFRWWGNEPGGGVLPNPFLAGDETTLRSWLRLLNFKANHRKLIVAGFEDESPAGLVTSGNPHDASSAHSNVALRFSGRAALDLAESELEVARWSGADLGPGWADMMARSRAIADRVGPADARIRALTEAAIRDAALDALAGLEAGDEADLAMFYMGHRDLIDALVAAAARGARLRLVLDANRDAFGRTKNGIPNRSVVHELRSRSTRAAERGDGRPIEVRWARTAGEQFHTKLLAWRSGGRTGVLLGSANWTRRNLDDFNLEANVEIDVPETAAVAQDVERWFDALWSRPDLTLPEGAFVDTSWWSAFKYRVMESTGLSTF